MVTAVRDTRQTIVTSALQLFHRQGYASTTVQQVAEAAAISKGNLTYHFPNKLSLFTEAHSQAADYLKSRIMQRSFDEAVDTVSGVEAFTRRVRRWMIDAEAHFVGCMFTNIAVEAQHSDREAARLARQTLLEAKEILTVYLATGQQLGEVRSDFEPGKLSQAFFWMYEGALTLSRVNDDPKEFDAFCSSIRLWLSPP
ncbi:MAG: TetR/AcrR family transcriptional regulator [Candidatus Sericytochromatia bacterium]|nr:TetR/AcrR family transcriptional regulator [Candidatus Sericytochromatia bacterium]